MPVTPVYGLPFEHEDDQPLHSLTGGSSGTELILAEEVEAQLERIDQSAADLALVASRGWRPVGSGVETSVGTFDIDATAGGDYPAGTFDMFRLHLRGHLDAVGTPWIRINADATNIYRRGLWVTQLDGTTRTSGDVFSSYVDDSSHFRVCNWGSTTGNTCTVHLYRTGEAGLIGATAEGARHGGGVTTHLTSRFWGRISSALLLSSIRVGGTFGGSAEFSNVRWWLEGYRP